MGPITRTKTGKLPQPQPQQTLPAAVLTPKRSERRLSLRSSSRGSATNVGPTHENDQPPNVGPPHQTDQTPNVEPDRGSTTNVGLSDQGCQTPNSAERRVRSRSTSISRRGSIKNDVTKVVELSRNRRLSLRSSSTPRTAPSTPQDEAKGQERSARSKSKVPRPIKSPKQRLDKAQFGLRLKDEPIVKISNEEKLLADRILR